MIKCYREKNVNMLYWVEDGVVMCDDEYDSGDPMQSCFTVEEFNAIKNDKKYFEEV